MTTLKGNSQISTESVSGGGGSVTLNVNDMVHLANSQVSTSVQEGVGNGGDLTINNAQFIIMNNGKIIAQANEGQGGNIHLASEQFVSSPTSVVSASSKLGIDGSVNIEAPDETVSDSLINISDDNMDASKMMKRPCTAEDLLEENRSHFYVNPINGVQPAPYDRQGSGILPAARPQTATAQHRTTTAKTTMASTMTECRKTTVQPIKNTSVPLF